MSFEWLSYLRTKGVLYETEQLVGWVQLIERGATQISRRSLRIWVYSVGTHVGERVLVVDPADGGGQCGRVLNEEVSESRHWKLRLWSLLNESGTKLTREFAPLSLSRELGHNHISRNGERDDKASCRE